MIYESIPITFCFQILILLVKSQETTIYKIHPAGQSLPHQATINSDRIKEHNCVGTWIRCVTVNNYKFINSYTKNNHEEQILPYHYQSQREYDKFHPIMKSFLTEPLKARRYLTRAPGMMRIRSLPDTQGRLPENNQMHFSGTFINEALQSDFKNKYNYPMGTRNLQYHGSATESTYNINNLNNVAHKQVSSTGSDSTGTSTGSQKHENITRITKFTKSLDRFERKFYEINFAKLTTISPAVRQENGISFVQSGILLLLTLLALNTEVDSATRAEINRCVGFQFSETDAIEIIKYFISSLPESSEKLRFRLSSRLMLWPGTKTSQRFRSGEATALMLQVEQFNGTETLTDIASILNKKIEIDTGGAIHDTFDEDDVSSGVTAVLVTTLYVRGSWRVAPTVLNGSRPFNDHEKAPKRTVRMIRINDIMNYAHLREWDAEAIEIFYATPGLSLLMLVPRNNSLRNLVHHVTKTSVEDITAKMRPMRVAATIPLYTLRMTLLLPNKLQSLNIPSLVEVSNKTRGNSLRLSHAVQRIMFWAEAGRNAYKDDGIEWDLTPDLQVFVDKPYIFFVRWRNFTLINGNFVL